MMSRPDVLMEAAGIDAVGTRSNERSKETISQGRFVNEADIQLWSQIPPKPGPTYREGRTAAQSWNSISNTSQLRAWRQSQIGNDKP